MSTILLIDLSSILHPLWHTTQGSSNPNECSIQTVARVRALASSQRHVAVCCDSGRSFRRDIDPTYKANRPESDATLQHQMTLARETLVGDGFPVWAVPGFEADDLLASAAHLAHVSTVIDDEHAHHVILATSDKDMFQLVSDRVTVHRVADTKKALQVTPDVVQQEYGIAPNQMRDYLALVGDASDNIKGADGIGPKKAAAMLARYGNLDDLYAALDKGEAFQPATAASLREFRPRLETVRALVTLRTDAPLPFEEVFRERVPADVAVFGGFDGDENMGGSGEASGRNSVVGEQRPDVDSRGTIAGHSADSSATGPSHAGTGADSTRVRAGGPQESPAKDDSGLHQQPSVGAVGIPAQVTAPVDPMQKLAHETIRPPIASPGATSQGVAVVQSGQPSAPPVLGLPSALQGWQGFEPENMHQAAWLADQMFKSRLFSAYGSMQAVLSTFLAGKELGLTMMASLRAFHIIEGKPCLSADLIRAITIRSPECEVFRCTRRDAEGATFITKRKGQEPIELTFTVVEGRQAFPGDDKSWQKSGWGRNPADMCVARASAKLARLVYPDVVHGFYAPEEFES